MAAVTLFTPQRFIVQWIACLALVLLTYNPFGRSFYHWVTGSPEELFLKLVVGLGLLFIYVFLIWVIFSSVGRRGLVAGGLLWMLAVYQVLQWLPTETPVLRRSVTLACLATLLAVGLAWPHLTTRFSGQLQKRYLIPKKKKLI
jgi:hypothetical protein